MNWEKLTSAEQLDQLKADSKEKKAIIFKHSTRCSISQMALDRLERSWDDSAMENKVTPYFLDLIQHRDISAAIADKFGIAHESPQLLVIDQGECSYHASHMGINYRELQGKV